MSIEELKELKEEYKRRFKYLTIELENKIFELEKSEQQKSRRWKPEIGKDYYFITECGEIECSHYCNDDIDEKYYNFHNMFETKEEAEFMVEKLKVLAEMREFADDEQEWDGCNAHWTLTLHSSSKQIDIDSFYEVQLNAHYFSSKEQVQKAIEAIGEERLKKYYFEVEG